MSNAVFPVLPGQTWPRTRTFQFSSAVHRAGARRFALARQEYPTWLYRINYSYLRQADYETLGGFFMARGGRLDDFLFDDRDDNAVIDQVIGLGDGANKAFQLAREWGGVVQPVVAPNVITNIKVAGVSKTYTLGANGAITLSAAAASGAQVTWSGTFRWRCGFTRDSQDFDEFMRRLYTTRSLEFETFQP